MRAVRAACPGASSRRRIGPMQSSTIQRSSSWIPRVRLRRTHAGGEQHEVPRRMILKPEAGVDVPWWQLRCFCQETLATQTQGLAGVAFRLASLHLPGGGVAHGILWHLANGQARSRESTVQECKASDSVPMEQFSSGTHLDHALATQ